MPVYFYESDIGKIGIAEDGGEITHLYFTKDQLTEEIEIFETPILKVAAQ